MKTLRLLGVLVCLMPPHCLSARRATRDATQANGQNHDGGPLFFGPDGKLYGVTGHMNRARVEQNQAPASSCTSAALEPQATAVPEPSAILLAGSALGSLLLLRVVPRGIRAPKEPRTSVRGHGSA